MSFNDELRKAEEDLILKYLELAWGNMAEAARLANVNRGTFSRKVYEHGIDPNVFKKERTA